MYYFYHIFHIYTYAYIYIYIFILELKLTTIDIDIESTDHDQYINYASSHPEHTKRSIVFFQTLIMVDYVLKRMISRITDLKWNLGFSKENIQRNLMRTKWERLSFVKELNAYHLLLRTLKSLKNKKIKNIKKLKNLEIIIN